jgi:hypothetical protein
VGTESAAGFVKSAPNEISGVTFAFWAACNHPRNAARSGPSDARVTMSH